MTTPKSAGSNGNGTAKKQGEGKLNGNGINALLAEAEAVKELLRTALGRTNQLLVALKRQRKQTQVIESAFSALRQWQPLEP